MSWIFKSAARQEWRTAKKTHAATLKKFNITFDEGLGPLVDKLDALWEQFYKLETEAEKLGKKAGATEAEFTAIENKMRQAVTPIEAQIHTLTAKAQSYVQKIEPLSKAKQDPEALKAGLALHKALDALIGYGTGMGAEGRKLLKKK
jgi:predicted  nucleic acid-binding Zn-ribbon protein